MGKRRRGRGRAAAPPPSDDESSGDSGDSSDSDSDNGGIRGGDSSGSKRASMADELASVTSEYTAGLVDKLAVALAKLISVDVGVSLEKLDEDISHMSGATSPYKTRKVSQDGFLTRRAALVDAFGSHLQNRAAVHRSERQIERKRTLMMKVRVSHKS